MDYYLNEHHSIGIGGRRNNRISQRIASSKTIISNAKESNTLFSENSFDIDRVDYNLNPYYEFKTETDKLLIDFNSGARVELQCTNWEETFRIEKNYREGLNVSIDSKEIIDWFLQS